MPWGNGRIPCKTCEHPRGKWANARGETCECHCLIFRCASPHESPRGDATCRRMVCALRFSRAVVPTCALPLKIITLNTHKKNTQRVARQPRVPCDPLIIKMILYSLLVDRRLYFSTILTTRVVPLERAWRTMLTPRCAVFDTTPESEMYSVETTSTSAGIAGRALSSTSTFE